MILLLFFEIYDCQLFLILTIKFVLSNLFNKIYKYFKNIYKYNINNLEKKINIVDKTCIT